MSLQGWRPMAPVPSRASPPARGGGVSTFQATCFREESTARSSQRELGVLAAAAVALPAAARAYARRWRRLHNVRSRRSSSVLRRYSASAGSQASAALVELLQLGRSPAEKALNVNLDPKFYGSFAEIGAGQEVSRTFLQAGAAAGTVARSLSAYDMQMSDATYGQSKRYVTSERLEQMLKAEYNMVEETLRATRGDDTRFFSFATTLAAKAFMSDRECEGWVGIMYQAEAGQGPSTVKLHVRMIDPTAQQQGEAIGILGTNLVYMCHRAKDPYLISSCLLDGIVEGRLQVDYASFEGPAFPEGTVDSRLLAMRMVQFRLAPSVLLMYDKASDRYKQEVPNFAFYKTPVVVQRSRYRPVTYMHGEVIGAAARQLVAELGENMTREPMQLLDLQIDDITRPAKMVETAGRLERARKLLGADSDGDGRISCDELRQVLSKKLPVEEIEELLQDFDIENEGSVTIDALTGYSRESILATEYLDRFNMLEPLKKPILVSSYSRTFKLVEYLARYTNQAIVVAVGGGQFSIKRAFFNEAGFKESKGGMLEAFGRLFAYKARIFQFPTISEDGRLEPPVVIEGPDALLNQYFIQIGKMVPIATEYISPEVLDPSKNEKFTLGSTEVIQLIQTGSSDWTKFVPPEVAASMKQRQWFARLSQGKGVGTASFKILNAM